MHSFYKFIYYKLLGWKIEGNTTMSQNTIKKAVIIAAPHTSWQDFFIGVFLRRVLNIKTNFVGKKELFIWPFGYYFKAVGGVPLNRSSNENKVEAIAKEFNKHDEFRITFAPEGTRKKVVKWRTGFYYIAKESKVPIIMFTLDFKNKKNVISEPFYPTDNMEEDFKFMRGFFNGVIGKKPEFS
ncbi:1-acyl-sn-glycerol-3-phosphate acyltransferase [Lacinutrix sp.]|uniref:1-acyl-sn-glycerol-3-phosphate acyltransferase n=1 Tax=Lacinutrix sp. TaxID=1937692 RepID=UPI0025C166A6|nr:1-acyl-sn-glycerol-3-phosphate acyltransferase [Lacinutrix sp.]